MITYLLKSGILLFVFYTVYRLWLENEKMLHFNRIYLLASLIFSLLLPLQLISLKYSSSSKIIPIELDEIVIQKTSQNLITLVEHLNLNKVLIVIYLIMVSVLTIRFLLNLFSLYNKTIRSEVQLINGEKIILINEPVLPHSFLNVIFINKEEFENDKIASELIAHEKAHLDQNHTLDILFIEVIQIVFWFNPFVLLYKKAIKLNHEFLADEAVNNQFDEVSKYQFLLLDIASNKENVPLASNINYLITKKRLIMMTKKESSTRMVLKVFSIGIISSLLLFVFSCKDNSQESNIKIENKKSNIEVETQPEYPGGMEAFYKFVGENYEAPEESGLKGKVIISFMVEKDGSLTDFKIVRDIGFGTGKEAIRVLRLCPKWKSGKINNEPVRTLYSLPITIQTAD